MSVFKRSIVYLRRQWRKNLILAIMMAILGGALIATMSASRALDIMEETLLNRIPAVATIIYDYTSRVPWEQLSREEISLVGELPYVRTYDFTLRPNFYSEDLVWPEVFNPGAFGPRGRAFIGRGVNNPEIADLDSGIIHLVEGRTFTQEEINASSPVVVIPYDFSVVNEISIGSMIMIENVVYNSFANDENDSILAQRQLEVEVIGIVTRDVDDIWGDPDYFYMPIGLAEDMLFFDINTKIEFDEEAFRGLMDFRDDPIIQTVFVLNSPRDLEVFKLEAINVLPEGWIIDGIDESFFAPVLASMDSILVLAKNIQYGAIVTSFFILTLVLVLFFRDRKNEIGIYMALGEKRIKVVIQILSEVLLVTTIGIGLALIVGQLFSLTISNHLFEQHLIEQMNNEQHFFHNEIPWELQLFNPGEVSIEEALELFHVTLAMTEVLRFIVIAMAVATISTLFSISYALKLKPRELLILE